MCMNDLKFLINDLFYLLLLLLFFYYKSVELYVVTSESALIAYMQFPSYIRRATLECLEPGRL